MASVKLSELAAAGKTSVAPDYLYGEEAGVSVAVIGPKYLALAPATGSTVTLPASTRHFSMTAPATLAALTIVLPPSPKDGQVVSIGFVSAVTALTTSAPGGATVSGTLGSNAANSGFTLVYQASTNGWTRAA